LPGQEIGRLRKNGVAVTEETEQPLFCFLGDTTVSILQDDDNGSDAERIFACPTVIIECSFLTDDCRENAARSRHVLWSDLRPHIVSHPDTTFVLTHFSHRWSTSEVADFFAREDLPNVVPWIPSSVNHAGGGLCCQPVVGGAEPQQIDEVWSHF
jgi:ribonuclease Z